jgi:hypothetical protein
MSRIYKTAKGQTVDMDRVKLANETTIAVGNMKVNARGDLIGQGGTIAQGRNQIMDQVYAVPDGSSDGYSPNRPKTPVAVPNTNQPEENKSKSLHDLANSLITPTTDEPVVEDTTDSTAEDKPSGRGSLASSVAKTVTVNQGPTPDPRKPKGPSRI